MKITVNLDTQAVITQPSPLRFKAGCFNPVEIGFTRSSQSVPVPDGTVIEFALKPKNQWTGGLLAYLNVFTLVPGNLYTGSLNCATTALLSALGLSDQTPFNDLAQLDASAEVTWSFNDQKFRSATFAVTVEAPLADDNAVATPDPELYPAPAEVARKSDLPVVATPDDAAAGTRADVVMSPLAVTQWFDAKLPGTPSLALLGDNSWGLPDLSSYTGSIAGDGTNVANVSGIQLNSLSGNQFYDDGSGCWISTATLQAPGMNGIYGASFYDNNGTWSFNSGIDAPSFSGDGSSVSNVSAIQLSGPYGYSLFDTGGGSWQIDGGINTGWINASFSGDGSGLSNVNASQLSSPYGYSIYDAGGGSWQVSGTLTGSFSGDGSGLSNVNANQLNSLYGYSIYDSGWGSWQVSGTLNGSFSGDGSGLGNVNASQLNSLYGYSIYDSGWGNWQVNGNLYANSFSGDGSGLGNINASQLNSPYGYSIYDSGWGSWQVNGWMYGSFSGDGSQLQNVSAQNTQYAQYAYCDEYGNEIAYTYVQQSGYYGSLSVGNADWANNVQYANYANCDNWGYQLYGAGNVQWNFFGGYPNPGDVVTFDGSYWSPSPGNPVPITVANVAGRFASSGLRTGWLIKQLDNRTVYQVLDPNDCATELGWVPVGPFILVPANSTPLVIDNTSPTLAATIHCTAGTWSDNPASYIYQWNRNGLPISGATTLSYTVGAADDGISLQCVVSATNAAGTGSDNAVIPLVVLNPPVSTVAPTITPAGTPNVADALSLTSGTWTGYGYTTTYQWKRAGVAIAGATAATYTLALADAGQAITCAVTRTNIRGAATVTSAATAAVTNLIAVNTALPTLNPTAPFTGAVVTCSPGTWNHHPTSYGYQWRRNGTAIAGATGSTYTVATGDLAATISCAVTATNLAGTSGAVATAESSAVIPIRNVLADSSLLGFWKLDETSGSRIDVSGNGRNLTPSETITTVPGPFGWPCAAFRKTGYLQNTALTPTFTGTTITASLWVRLLALEEGNFMTQWSGGGWLNLGVCAAGLRFGFGHDCLDNIVVPVSTGTWHHVTQSWDGNQIRATVDGHEYTLNKANMPENPPRLTNANAPFDIGCSDTWNGSSRANADICCVGMWKRALSAAETTALYNNGAGLIYPF